MTTSAQEIFDSAKQLLQDVQFERWDEALQMRWLNEAQKVIVLHKPEANPVTSIETLVAGVEQSLPVTGLQFLRANRNYAGAVRGRAVRMVDVDDLDAINPDWPAATEVAVVQSVMFNPKNPKVYMVAPPNNAAGQLQIIYSAVPVAITADTDNITVDDSYGPAIVDYVCYRALLAETEAMSRVKAGQHLQTCLALLGLDTRVKRAFDINLETESDG